MSYRSIKRVLGESSLERKCRFLFGACLLLLITASFWLYGKQTEKLVYEQNPNTGRLLVDQIMLAIHWKKLETDTRFLPTVERLTESLSKEEYRWEFFTAKKLPPENDKFARKVLAYYVQTESQRPRDPDARQFFGQLLPDRNEYQYYEPMYVDASECVLCHLARTDVPLNSPPGNLGLAGGLGGGVPLNEGDLMAIAKVTIPNGPTQERISWNQAILLTTAIVTVFLAMVASYVIVRYVIVKPLRHLRDVSDAISHGDITLRAEIHTGDEFESLAVAFNRMLRHLVATQDELRQVNTNLDGKVDELAQVNMRLYEMNTIKSDFLATMSHELRTPLNSILGFSEVLGSIDSLQDKQKRYVENIQTSGRMLLEMINDILDLAKIESGKMDVRLTDFRIEQIVRAQCDMARPLTEKKNIDLEVEVQAELPPTHQDQARVQQILNNLLSNAIKFTPEGGRITVNAGRAEESFLVMRVIDTGVGIAEDDQQTIFEKFRQGRTGVPSGDAMTREYSGTGLGLSIVKELCKSLGGEVIVESELGKGSTFTVRLPWDLQEQPRLDSSLAEGFEEFTKPRFDLARELRPALAEPLSAEGASAAADNDS